ncbi:MAG: AIR synthase-related protein [Spirochaetota bacterium]
MKNDDKAVGRKISVRPTLLVTLMGAIGDVRKAMSTDFMDPGDLVYVLGDTSGELGCTMFERVLDRIVPPVAGSGSSPGFGATRLSLGEAPDVDLAKAERLYRGVARAISGRVLRSCHDCSDGGMAVALAESCLGGRVGLKASLDGLPGNWDNQTPGSAARALFSESGGRFVVSIRQEDRERLEETLSGLPFRLIGQTTDEPGFSISLAGKTMIQTSLDGIRQAFMTPISGERI